MLLLRTMAQLSEPAFVALVAEVYELPGVRVELDMIIAVPAK
ncbi:hypothetical protein [Acuticoccus sp. I52.16.1]|nr:hypothetical protein [Acuticoccus sp. I52.16.1]